MFYNDGLRQDGGYDDIDINITNQNVNTNMNTNTNMNMNVNEGYPMGTVSGPIIEPGRERYVQRNIFHEVKQGCPFMQNLIIKINKFSIYML
ncbi:MAG: hypothetical protein MR439_04305 [Clostridium sp.]|nr:hypothetical protein [Clostridium sp.]